MWTFWFWYFAELLCHHLGMSVLFETAVCSKYYYLTSVQFLNGMHVKLYACTCGCTVLSFKQHVIILLTST